MFKICEEKVESEIDDEYVIVKSPKEEKIVDDFIEKIRYTNMFLAIIACNKNIYSKKIYISIINDE